MRGRDWRSGQPITWERRKSDKPDHDGQFDYLETWARSGFAVRIESDKYLPEERSGFTIEDGQVSLEIKLKKAPNITATVNKADGTPAAKAKAYLVLAGQNLNISNGTEVYNNSQCGGGIADAQTGRFSFRHRLKRSKSW